MKTLTREHIEENEKQLGQSNGNMSDGERNEARLAHYSITTTDSDYLSTIPTETTDFINNYGILEGEESFDHTFK